MESENQNAEKAKPSTTIEIFGEKKVLKGNFRTLIAFERETGKSALDIRNLLSIEGIMVLIWAAIGGKESGKTVDQVIDALEGRKIPELQGILTELFKQSELTDEQKNDVAA